MNPIIISNKEYTRVAVSRNIEIAKAIHAGLMSRGYDSVMFVDKIKKESVYRVVVCEK